MRLPRVRRQRLLVALLSLSTIVCATGWFLAAREGRGIPPECYRLRGETLIGFAPVHGSDNERSTYAVAEGADEVMLGYWEERASGGFPFGDYATTMQAYGGEVEHQLVMPLGERRVVDPAGHEIPAC